MIEINLIPDVKKELIKSERIRSTVVSITILVGLISIGIVVILSLSLGAQAVLGKVADDAIARENAKLQAVPDLSNTLTIQNQLSKLTAIHESKHINSRVFDVLTAIIPAKPNDVSVTKLNLDSETNTITIDAQAAEGYSALEVFKKTIAATKFQYNPDGEEEVVTVPLAQEITESNVSFGEDDSGRKILRFTISFVYPDELFDSASERTTIIAPTKRNVTDSFVGIPKSLFTNKASDVEEEK